MRTPDPGAGRSRRQALNRAGQWAETLAALSLVLKGYRILARRYVVRGGEIDIVARRGSVVAFVEVKNRPTLEAALEAVTAGKQRRIERAAAVWLARNGWAAGSVLRGDAVLVPTRRWPVHVPDAFTLRIG